MIIPCDLMRSDEYLIPVHHTVLVNPLTMDRYTETFLGTSLQVSNILPQGLFYYYYLYIK